MRILIYFTLLALATGIALLRGTPVERALAATLLVGNLATFGIVRIESFDQFSYVSLLYFLTDFLLAVLLCWVAVRWPTWASIMIAALQINGLLGHVVKLLSPETLPLSYAMLLKIWGWCMVAVLLASRVRPNMRRPLSGQRWPYFSRARDGHTIVSG